MDSNENHRRKRNNSFDASIDRKHIENIIQILEQIMQQSFLDLTNDMVEPGILYIYGFNLHIKDDGSANIEVITHQQFDNSQQPLKFNDINKKDSSPDYLEYYDSVAITAEISDLNQPHLSVTANDRQIIITIDEDHWNFQKTIDLPCFVDSETMQYTYHNGILDILIKKRYLLR